MSEGKKNTFTPENARQMQMRGAEKRKENTAFRRDCKAVLQDIISQRYKTEDGREVDGRMLLMTKLFRRAYIETDLAAIKFICEMIGEAPLQQIDVTSGGNPLRDNPLMGLSLDEIQSRLDSALKARDDRKR